jgi:hypothetical protein
MRAVLRGGPLDRQILEEIPAEVENINIPANSLSNPRYAQYIRVGEQITDDGPLLLFNFVAVHSAFDTPVTEPR